MIVSRPYPRLPVAIPQHSTHPQASPLSVVEIGDIPRIATPQLTQSEGLQDRAVVASVATLVGAESKIAPGLGMYA